MPLSFLKKRNSPLWARIHSDDTTRLRLKYDTYYHIFESQSGTRVVKDGKEFVMLSSNDYLGLSHHPKIKEAGKKALEKWGSSTTGARLANGGRIFHQDLEEKLASFLGKEACHVFSAGYLACASAVTGFSDRKDLLLADKNLHSSLWSGIKLSGARCERFAHNNPDHLREILEYEDDSIEKILVLEGVYSMEGHIAKLPEFIQLAKEFKAFVVMDDAHGFGVLGSEGRGTADHFGMTDQVDVLCGSFSKSLAGAGGFVASTREAIDYMRSHSKQTIFSAALAPLPAHALKPPLKSCRKNLSITSACKRIWNATEPFLQASSWTHGRAKPLPSPSFWVKRKKSTTFGKPSWKKAFIRLSRSLPASLLERT